MNADTIEKLVRFSKGVPPAMSLASELILRSDDSDFPQQVEQHALIITLAGRLMREIAGTPLERYAEAASVLLKFDQELLQTVLGEPVPTDSGTPYHAYRIDLTEENLIGKIER